MNTNMFDAVYEFYKNHYGQIEHHEIYKWKAVVHFKNNWDIEAEDFASMLEKALKKTANLMSSGNYYPRRMVIWAAQKEPEKVRQLFKYLYDLSIDLKDRIESFQAGIDTIVELHKEGNISKSYQDDRAVMVYLNMRYPDKYYLYKYGMFVDFARLIDYADIPKAGDIDLVFVFESMCDMILKRVMQDEELLNKYEERKKQYYDPAYHLLVQDIIYSVHYFNVPDVLNEEKEISVKSFNLQAKEDSIILKGMHIDHIEEAKAHKELGDAGEEFVYQYERMQIKKYKLGRDKQVRWIAKLDGDGLGYDILSYDKFGNEIYIEVKTTTGAEDDSIFITSTELEMSEKFPGQYRLYRVYEFDKLNTVGKISVRKGSLKELCISAQTYKVNFQPEVEFSKSILST